MLSLKIRLKVKFRAFFYTFAEFDKAWEVNLAGGVADIPPTEEPQAGYKLLWNRNGIRLSFWGLPA